MAIALISPFCCLLLRGEAQTSPPFYTLPHPPDSPVSSVFREGRVRGHLDTPCGLASRWCGGFSEGRWSNTIRLGLWRWQLAPKKRKRRGVRGSWPPSSVQLGGSFHSPPPATCWMTIWGSGKPHNRGRIIFLVAEMDNNKSQEICQPNPEWGGREHCSCLLLFSIKCAELLFNAIGSNVCTSKNFSLCK